MEGTMYVNRKIGEPWGEAPGKSFTIGNLNVAENGGEGHVKCSRDLTENKSNVTSYKNHTKITTKVTLETGLMNIETINKK